MSRRDPFSHGPAKDSPVENSIALVRIRKFFAFFGSNKTLKFDIFQLYQTIFFLWSFFLEYRMMKLKCYVFSDRIEKNLYFII